MILLRAENIKMAFGNRVVLDEVSFTLRAGQVLALVGANGSGKSTLLRILAGLCKPLAGEVALNYMLTHGAWRADQAALSQEQVNVADSWKRIDSFSQKELARCLAYLAQHYSGDVPFSVREMLMLGRSPWQNYFGQSSPEDASIVEKIMRLVGVGSLSECVVNTLSGGELQRVMLGRVFCQQASVFLLDEPTSAMDYAHALYTVDMVRKYCNATDGAAILVLHDLNLAAFCADRVLALKDGRPVAFGTPEEVFVSDTLRRLYDCEFIVDEHPVYSRLRLSPYLNRS